MIKEVIKEPNESQGAFEKRCYDLMDKLDYKKANITKNKVTIYYGN